MIFSSPTTFKMMTLFMRDSQPDHDLPNLQKKRLRVKKPRGQVLFSPANSEYILGMRDETTYNGKVRRGKRVGFDTFNQLACKNCKVTFHKRVGLESHTKEIHGRESRPTPTFVSRSTTKPVSRKTPVSRTKIERRSSLDLNTSDLGLTRLFNVGTTAVLPVRKEEMRMRWLGKTLAEIDTVLSCIVFTLLY